MTDERALLAAIAADPADDTARLVYADCLEEHGNVPRANFIRLQVEAARLHPDSNARPKLENEALDLFASHWVDWWGEVCTAVGLTVPVRKPTGTIGRLVQRGLRTFAGYPYKTSQFHVSLDQGSPSETRLGGWAGTTFSRGFPDSLSVSLPLASPERNFLHRWPRVSPLMKLHAIAPYTEQWIDSPHLAGLCSLTLEDYDQVVLHGALNSPHLANLDELIFRVPDYGEAEHAAFAGELEHALQLPRAKQLKRLSLRIWSDRAAEVLANAASLAALEAITVELHRPTFVAHVLGAEEFVVTARRLETLARSPRLRGLRELTIVGDFDTRAIEAAILHPTWSGLRKLVLHMHSTGIGLDVFAWPTGLPELEELRLLGVSFGIAQMDALVRSPLLKRLRHLAVRGFPALSVDEDIANAVDPDRIETLAIGARETPRRVIEMLRDRFGDRLKLLD